jgi:acetyl-CoA acetyltransferase
MYDPERIPVIIGVGEIMERPNDPADGLEPLALMASALGAAERDAGESILRDLDSLDNDLPAQLAIALGITPRRTAYGPVGGETPLRLLHDAALAIRAGMSRVAAICGGEAMHTLGKARANQLRLPWTPLAERGAPAYTREAHHPLTRRHGLERPTDIYPLYESAVQAAWGQSPAEAQQESGALWSRLSALAATRPASWSKRSWSAEDIVIPAADNRLIAWPYTKRMVANPAVNQAAAIFVTSLAYARAKGIADERLVHIWGGASANEPGDYLQRDSFARAAAQESVLAGAMELLDGGQGAFVHHELYSCFPVVPKMARRVLGLDAGAAMSVTGGLSFFGAPLNNYMAHAAVAMTETLRADAMAGSRGTGLLYGQGGYVTKHHALVLGTEPCSRDADPGHDRQADADSRRGPAPTLVEDYSGPAAIEAFTLVYGRDGAPLHGTLICRNPDGERLVARVTGDDGDGIALLTDGGQSPVGREGMVRAGAEGLLVWRS